MVVTKGLSPQYFNRDVELFTTLLRFWCLLSYWGQNITYTVLIGQFATSQHVLNVMAYQYSHRLVRTIVQTRV